MEGSDAPFLSLYPGTVKLMFDYVLNNGSQDGVSLSTSIGSGFDSTTNRVIIFSQDGSRYEISKDRKDRIAEKIITYILQFSIQTNNTLNL